MKRALIHLLVLVSGLSLGAVTLRAQALRLPQPTSEQGPVLVDVRISLHAPTADPWTLFGSANLPDGAIVTLSLRNVDMPCYPHCYTRLDDVRSEGGSFIVMEKSSSSTIRPGSYVAELVVHAFGQPPKVVEAFGRRGENLRGPHVVTLEEGGRYAPVQFSRPSPPTEAERIMGRMIRFQQRLIIASDGRIAVVD